MSENIIKTPNSTIIINGGDPLKGCPESWEEAKEIEAFLNKDKSEDEILWSFDCGYKLDYDGGVMMVSSRFYPPKTHYGNLWDGKVSIYVLGEKVREQDFEFPNIEELKTAVENYIKSQIELVKDLFKNTSL